MKYNTCKTCGADKGRAGLLINGECENCHITRESGYAHINVHLVRSQEELKKTMEILG